ncbi:MAG: AAA family ATPase, partial [Deltaproteobacteria bacterium]|nr:AAA family ATPase [Deltaproteobacteria bacterium]
MAWVKATKARKRLKLTMNGPTGSYKTLTSLLLSNHLTEDRTAVIDVEKGTLHYTGQFNFLVPSDKLTTADAIVKVTNEILAAPGPVRTIIIDSFSLFCERVTRRFVDLYLKREIRSKGHKTEYYTLQPRDYAPINAYITNYIVNLIDSDLHVIAICQQSDMWDNNMNIVGVKADAYKKLDYYFDTVLQIEKNGQATEASKRWKAVIKKDRTGKLPVDGTIPWVGHAQICEELTRRFGFVLAETDQAQAYVAAPVVESEATQTPAADDQKEIGGGSVDANGPISY